MARKLDDWKTKNDPATVIADLRRELKDAQSQAATAEVLRELLGTAKLDVALLRLPEWAYQPKAAGAPGVPQVMLSDLN